VYSKLGSVRLQDAVIKVTGAEVKDDVEDVEQVGRVVKREPDGHVVRADLVEREPIDEYPEVVDERYTDHKRPPVGKPTMKRDVIDQLS